GGEVAVGMPGAGTQNLATIQRCLVTRIAYSPPVASAAAGRSDRVTGPEQGRRRSARAAPRAARAGQGAGEVGAEGSVILPVAARPSAGRRLQDPPGQP